MKRKRIIYYLNFIMFLFFICGSSVTQKVLSSNPQVINDTLRFNQVCIDTIYLPVYKPSDKGRSLLDTVINSKHQKFREFPDGTFEIAQTIRSDTLISVLYQNVNLDFFSQYGWNSFKGIVYYHEHTFLIRDSVSDGVIELLFENTKKTTGFREYADKFYVKKDEKINWRFIVRKGKLHLIGINPMNTETDCKAEDFE